MAQMSFSGSAPGLDKRNAKSSQYQIELFQAADKRIAELNKTGVAQGLTEISEPKCQHLPVLVNMENFDNWSHEAMDISNKGGKTWELETDRRLRRMNKEFVREEIEVNDILKDVTTHDGSTKKCRHVMFIGPAGSGKTTLLRRIAKYAAQEKYEMLKDKLLINADLRTFSMDKKMLPSQGLLGSTFSDWKSEKMDQRYQWILENSEKVGFVIDSLDTLPFDLDSKRPRIASHELATPDVILHNLLAKELFPKSFIISSSREFKVRNMHPTVRPDRCILLDGLEEESVNDLIDGFLGKDKGAEMKKYIDNECPDIWPLLSIPVFLVFSTISFAQVGFKPKTMSGILIKYFLCLIHSPHALEEDIFSVLYKLMPMSFEGIRKGQVLFTLEDLIQFKLTPDLVRDLTSLIPQSHGTCLSSKLMQNDRFFLYFNHQTQQETLSAFHVLSLGIKEFKEFVKLELYVVTFGVVRRLVCGILLNDEVLEATKELTEITDIDQKKTVLLKSLRMKLKQRSKSELIELFIDLNEAKEAVGKVIRSSVRNIDFRDISLSPSDVQAVSFVMKHCKHLDAVDLYNCTLTARKMEILVTAVMQSNLKLKKLNIDENKNIGSGGMFHLGRFVKYSTLEELSARRCSLKSEHFEKFAEGTDNGTMLKRLDVSESWDIGSEGMFHLGRFLKNSTLEELSVRSCHLKSEHLEKFVEGAENVKLEEFDVSGNPDLGPEGALLLGKLVNNREVKSLNASVGSIQECKALKKFIEGLGHAKIDYLNLSDFLSHPRYIRSLLDLLRHVEKKLDLNDWKINKSEEQELQQRLNEIGSPSLEVMISDCCGTVLKASIMDSTSENLVELAISEENLDGPSAIASASHEIQTAVAETVDEEVATASENLVELATSEENPAGTSTTASASHEIPTAVAETVDKEEVATASDMDFGPEGGVLAVDECSLTIPPKSLVDTRNLGISMSMDFNNLCLPADTVPISPFLDIKFRGNLRIPAIARLPTWFKASKDSQHAIKIYKRYRDEKNEFAWRELQNEVKVHDEIIEFEVAFLPLRCCD